MRQNDNEESKLVSRRQLPSVVRRLRGEGKTIVTTNGSFDILHAGHIYLLHEAAQLGDVFIVGLNSDSSVRRYKNNNRPILPEHQRAALLCALEMVDYVTVFTEINPMKFLNVVRPTIHVNSSEYGNDCVEASTVTKYGGRVVLIPRVSSFHSTTEIITRILRNSKTP